MLFCQAKFVSAIFNSKKRGLKMKVLNEILVSLQNGEIVNQENVKVYNRSLEKEGKTYILMVKMDGEKKLLAAGEGSLFDDLNGEEDSAGKVCALSHENRLVLNHYFPYTKPQAFGTKTATFGLGDRLGIASPGHIKTIENHQAKPILAQQSIRELNLTNRTLSDLIDAATFATIQEGYKEGYGADGDHLKEEADIQKVLELGFSMLTLDCSDYIPTGLNELDDAALEEKFNHLDKALQSHYATKYAGKTFEVNGESINFSTKDVHRYALEYHEALKYMVHVYQTYIQKLDRPFDFEISIDETETVTSPQAHFFVANELKDQGVSVTSLAPRFCGEFQKGIDYIGDLAQFEKELSEHARIAEHFGYKLSIHSGSDKFSAFPIIAKYTKGVVHVKTAGTNWLEAIRVIADKNPDLYRRMHQFALERFDDALAYYHITPDLSSIAPLDETPDEKLAKYMDEDASRQLFHVTYGFILTEEKDGKLIFTDELYETLTEHEDAYESALEQHIGKHLDLLSL